MENSNESRTLTQILISVGFNVRNCGFKYIRDMILIFKERPHTKLVEMYAMIAQKTGQPSVAIETAVRTALKNSQTSQGLLLLEKLLGISFVDKNYPPRTREFICLMADFLAYSSDWRSLLNIQQ